MIARLLKESREIIANRANRAGLKPPSYYENKNPAVLALNLKTETDEVMPSHHDNDQEPKAELKTQSEYNTPG